MRILITSFPGYGHLCPMIPLIQALGSAGHQVAVATSATCTELLTGLGIAILPSGPIWHESEFDHEVDRPENAAAGGNTRLWDFLHNEVYAGMLDDVRRHVGVWCPDILLSNEYEAVGRTVAELEGIPYVLASHSARLSFAQRQNNQARLSAQLRRSCGLPEAAVLNYPLRWLHLNFTHPSFAVEGAEPPEAANEYSIQPAIYDDFNAPVAIDKRFLDGDGPIVLCTNGTVYNKNKLVLKAIIEACADQPYRVLMTGGPAFDTLQLGPLPANFAVYPYLPLSKIVPMVDVCITHGGSSTLHSILKYGKPLLLLPQGVDHFANAIVCERLQLAATILTDARYRDAVSPDNLAVVVRRRLNELISVPAYRENSLLFRDKLQQLPLLKRAIELLETLYLTGAPVLKN